MVEFILLFSSVVNHVHGAEVMNIFITERQFLQFHLSLCDHFVSSWMKSNINSANFVY